MMNDEDYMYQAYLLAKKAYDQDEVPIGAVIVKDCEIIGRGYNQKEHAHDVSAHAEMLAIHDASKKLGTWHLDGCTLYSTLEPCMMCSGAIIQSRISKVIFAVKVNRWAGLSDYLESHQYNHYPQIECNVLQEECSSLLSDYFKKKRNR